MKKKNPFIRFLDFIQSEKVGRHAGKITLGIFAIIFLSIAAMVHFADTNSKPVIEARATKYAMPSWATNEVRWNAVTQVVTFDKTVTEEQQLALLSYFYNTIDQVRLLHMVNMGYKIEFSTIYTNAFISGDTLYSPVNVDVDDFEALLKLM